MIVIHESPIKAEGSYDVPLQPVGPFLVLEYVSKSNSRKDYDDNMLKYEYELKVPYYLLFQPDVQELTLYHHTGEKYVSVPPTENGRHPIPELELEVAILEGWVRYWFRGELLPLPGDLLHALQQKDQQLQQKDQQLQQAEQRAETLAAEVERLRKLLEHKGE